MKSNGQRIPWRRVKEAFKHEPWKAALGQPGIYLFGVREELVYLGMTGGSLRRRLRGRYLCGKRSQCELAATYLSELLESGIDGFPAEVREWYRRGFGKSTVRIRHAAEFARIGIEDIWFAFIPTVDGTAARELEKPFIPLADPWNRNRSLPELLNLQDVGL